MSSLPSDITVPGRPEVHEVSAGVYAYIPDGTRCAWAKRSWPANPVNTYSEVAPDEPAEEAEPETDGQRKARPRREVAALKAEN